MTAVSDRFAIMAVDPGGVTGCAKGMFNAKRAGYSLSDLIDRAMSKNAISCWEVNGEPWEQAWKIALAYKDFVAEMSLGGLPKQDCYLVLEDFQLRQRSADLAPVAVNAGLMTLMMSSTGTWPLGFVTKQGPSMAKHTAPNERLKRWGVYDMTIGSEHKRDAIRHVCTMASRLLG